MVSECRITIPGEPSTDHRPRSSSRLVGGRIQTSHRRSEKYDAWKQRVRFAGLTQRPRGWPLNARYVVEVIGYLPNARPDADNLRGALDALEGVLWTNDKRCKPVVYDYEIDKKNPRVEVHAVIFEPKVERARINITIESI